MVIRTKLIDRNSRYRFESVEGYGNVRGEIYDTEQEVRTFFVHSGAVDLKIECVGNPPRDYSNDHIMRQIRVGAGQAVIFPTRVRYSIGAKTPFFVVQSSSGAPECMSRPPVLIEDTGDGKYERELTFPEIVRNPKRVNKPWGHELWISWFRDYHVLKQIGMKAGEMSSLQLHRHKLETNFLVSGEADVVDGYPMELSLSEEEMKARVRDMDWKHYTQRKIPGMYWTSTPGIVHRIISASDYIAYETSTPELDDVVRLSDKTGRGSGRIVGEHKS